MLLWDYTNGRVQSCSQGLLLNLWTHAEFASKNMFYYPLFYAETVKNKPDM